MALYEEIAQLIWNHLLTCRRKRNIDQLTFAIDDDIKKRNHVEGNDQPIKHKEEEKGDGKREKEEDEKGERKGEEPSREIKSVINLFPLTSCGWPVRISAALEASFRSLQDACILCGQWNLPVATPIGNVFQIERERSAIKMNQLNTMIRQWNFLPELTEDTLCSLTRSVYIIDRAIPHDDDDADDDDADEDNGCKRVTFYQNLKYQLQLTYEGAMKEKCETRLQLEKLKTDSLYIEECKNSMITSFMANHDIIVDAFCQLLKFLPSTHNTETKKKKKLLF